MGQAGKRTVRFAFWSAVLLVMLVSCQSALKDRPGGFQEEGAAGPAADDEKTELLVSAAASLTESMQILTERYEHMHPEVKVTLNLAGSGTLQKQIEQGAPVDLFVSAGTREMNALTEKGIVDPQDVRVLLRNRMAVIVPADSDIHLDNIEDLRQQDLFKIAIGEPDSVPAGHYARESLMHYRLWEVLEPRLLGAKDVRQVLAYVKTGNADAGFVYRTDAAALSEGIRLAFEVDPDSHRPIEYPAGVIGQTDNRAEAKAFLAYLGSRAAAEVFESFGFIHVQGK